MSNPSSRPHPVIKAILKANADTDYTQDSIEPGDGELSEFARQLDFYLRRCIQMMSDPMGTNWIRTIKSPRPRTIAGWFRLARRGQVWWPGKTFTIDLKDEQEGHSPPAGSAATPVPHKAD